jgi:HME family heavy-metal exporter
LISSTLLDFLVHPALFWLFGRKDAEAQAEAGDRDELDDPIDAPATTPAPRAE